MVPRRGTAAPTVRGGRSPSLSKWVVRKNNYAPPGDRTPRGDRIGKKDSGLTGASTEILLMSVRENETLS